MKKPTIGIGEIKFTLNPKDINLDDYVSDHFYKNVYNDKGYKSKNIFQSYLKCNSNIICHTNYSSALSIFSSVLFISPHIGYPVNKNTDFILFGNHDRGYYDVYNLDNTYLFSFRGVNLSNLIGKVENRKDLDKLKMKMFLEGRLV